MALGAGVVIPNVLRWYWWRMNGWGYSMGTFVGILLSLAALFFPDLPVYYVFPLICSASLIVSIAVSLATRSVDHNILVSFYTSVRPFGAWKHIRKESGLSTEELAGKSESVSLTIINIILAMLAICGLYLFPMYLVGHWYGSSMIWLGLAVAAIVTLRYTWYNNLPGSGEKADRA